MVAPQILRPAKIVLTIRKNSMVDSDESKRQEAFLLRTRRLIRFSNWILGTAACLLFALAGCCLIAPFLLGAQRFDGDSGAKKVAGEILSWQLPSSFVGVIGVSIDNSFFRFDVARFVHDKGRGSIVVAKSTWRAVQPPDDQEVRKKSVRDMVEWVVKPDMHRIDTVERKSRTLVVGGLEGEFEILRGEDRASTTKFRQVVGYFHSESANGYLLFEVEDEYMTDQEIEDFLNSIH